MDLHPFAIHRAEYSRLHRSNRMSVVAMSRRLKILIEHHYGQVTLMLMFHLNIVRRLQFHVIEVLDFHSVEREK